MMHAVVHVLYFHPISLYETAMRGTIEKRQPDYNKVSGNQRLHKECP